MEANMYIEELPGVIPYNYKKGEYLFRQGEQLEHVYYLTKGKCYRMALKENGEEHIYTYWEKKDYLGAFAIIYGREQSLNNIIANTACEGYKVPKKIFLQYIEDNPKILKELLIRAIAELNDFKINYHHLQERKIGNRICQILIDEAKEKGQYYVVSKKICYTEMAKYLGVHHVTISRIMKTLREEKIIEKRKDGLYLLDYDKVLNYAEGQKLYYE